MVKIFIWKMDTVLATKKGYTMLEMLVVMIIVCAVASLGLRKISNVNYEQYIFMNEYCKKQSEAIMKVEKVEYEKGIYFNEMGHVNMARTIEINNHNIVIHLGNGYLTYE